MRKVDLADHTLSRTAYEAFKRTVDALAATFTAKAMKWQSPNDVSLQGCQVTFNLESLMMTREELLAFNETAHWQKVLDLCRQYGFAQSQM
jgi:hypothetical protein